MKDGLSHQYVLLVHAFATSIVALFMVHSIASLWVLVCNVWMLVAVGARADAP